jgi:hypothetical protein
MRLVNYLIEALYALEETEFRNFAMCTEGANIRPWKHPDFGFTIRTGFPKTENARSRENDE